MNLAAVTLLYFMSTLFFTMTGYAISKAETDSSYEFTAFCTFCIGLATLIVGANL